MTIERLRASLGNVHAMTGAVAVLADQPITQKRERLYPELVPLIVELVCGRGAPEPKSTRVLLRYFVTEVAHAPELARELFAALAATPPRHALDLLHELYMLVRDRAAIPLLRTDAPLWVDAVIALDAGERLDEVLARLASAPTRELAVAAGLVGGERAREALGSGEDDAVHPIGLALLANPDDKAYFAEGGTPNRVTARRIHTALAARGPKQRMDALLELAKGLDDAPLERLLPIVIALGDKRADVGERAAAILAAYAKAARSAIRPVMFAPFLARAQAAIARGVTEAAREHLEIVRKRIPNAPAFGATKTVEAPLPIRAAAKKRGKAMLATMQDAKLDKSNERDAGIEAQIASDPDAAAPYLIYADWLQTRGDPRGHWITLHTLKGLAAKDAIATFLREHGESLLGPLRPFVLEDGPVEIEWFMGFVRRARFRAHATVDVVRAVLAATCGVFVQELVFANDGLQDEALALVRDMRPACLSRLAFGTRDVAPPALTAVLPRLVRDPHTRWAAALERLGELRKTKHEVDVDALPALDGPAIDLETVVAGLKQELAHEHPSGLASAMAAVFTPASRDAFALALLAQYRQIGRDQWFVAAAAALGGDATARALGRVLFEQRSAQRRIAVCDQLRAIASRGHAAALEELALAAFAPDTDMANRDTARQALAEHFAQAIDAGLAHVMPSGDARADAAQRAWLESMMVERRVIEPADLRALVGYRLAVARTLLWCERAEGRITALFRVDANGAPVRRSGEPYALAGTVGLVHPVELSDSELAGARTMFAEQAILQLARPTFDLSEAERASDSLTRFAKRRVGFYPIANTLRERGWHVAASAYDEDQDRWQGTNAFARRFDGVHIYATLGSTRGSIATVTALGEGGVRMTFDQLPVVVISELLWDLEVAHGWVPTEAPPPAPPPGGPAPTVERAKSGRSKCVVCTQAIAKDSLRIGIERMVETPTFRGWATVWLHPACRTKVPELAGVRIEGVDG